MSHYRRARALGASYFFTVVSYARQPILCDRDIREALRDAIQTVRLNRPFTIDAWGLLPDHLHCIWTLPEGDADFATRWSLIKRRVSWRCRARLDREIRTIAQAKRRESSLWQRRYWEHQIRDDADFARHADYIHFNPVKHGLCERPMGWLYSTFARFVEHGLYPADWGDLPELNVLTVGGE